MVLAGTPGDGWDPTCASGESGLRSKASMQSSPCFRAVDSTMRVSRPRTSRPTTQLPPNYM